MTRTGTESNLSYSIPSRDDDGISFRIASRENNAIRHVVPIGDLMLMTNAAEWRVATDGAVTPTTISVRPQSYVGCGSVQPLVVNNVMVYAEGRGGHVRELAYNWNNQGIRLRRPEPARATPVRQQGNRRRRLPARSVPDLLVRQ